MSSNSTVVAKKWSFLTQFNRHGGIPDGTFLDINFSELISEIKDSKVQYLSVTFTEVVDWDRAPMRKFFHGVVVTAFQKKLNSRVSGEQKPFFTFDDAKEFVKNAILGTSDGFHVKSTESLTPEAYMEFLHNCELLYLNMFQCTYDLRNKPTL